MSVKSQSFNRGVTKRVELNGFGTVTARPVGISIAMVFKGAVTITKRADGFYTIYSPKCRGGNGKGWTGMRGSSLVTIGGDDYPVEVVFSEAESMLA